MQFAEAANSMLRPVQQISSNGVEVLQMDFVEHLKDSLGQTAVILELPQSELTPREPPTQKE